MTPHERAHEALAEVRAALADLEVPPHLYEDAGPRSPWTAPPPPRNVADIGLLHLEALERMVNAHEQL